MFDYEAAAAKLRLARGVAQEKYGTALYLLTREQRAELFVELNARNEGI